MKTYSRRGGDARLEGCRVCADLISGPLPLERLANSKLGTLRETQSEKKPTFRETQMKPIFPIVILSNQIGRKDLFELVPFLVKKFGSLG